MYQNNLDSLERTLALTVAGIILFVVTNSFPFLGFKLQSQVHNTVLITGVREFYNQGMCILATVLLLTTIALLAAQMLGLLYVLVQLRLNRIPLLIK